MAWILVPGYRRVMGDWLAENMLGSRMTDHLEALYDRLARESARLAVAKSQPERALRSVWVDQIKREIDGELRFLGVKDMSDDELLAELSA